MIRFQLSIEESEFIAARIRQFDNEATGPQTNWLTPYVLRFNALPLLSAWTETIGIRPDGAVIKWSTEDEYDGYVEMEDSVFLRAALVEGAKQYSLLKSLIPSRPADARTCEYCDEAGGVAAYHNVICGVCGGVGWIEGTNPA